MTRSRFLSRLGRAVLAVTFVTAPAAMYIVLWRALGDDATNRAGYLLWLVHGPDSAAIETQAWIARAFFAVVVPGILAGAGFGWWRVLVVRRRQSGVTDIASRMRRI